MKYDLVRPKYELKRGYEVSVVHIYVIFISLHIFKKFSLTFCLIALILLMDFNFDARLFRIFGPW